MQLVNPKVRGTRPLSVSRNAVGNALVRKSQLAELANSVSADKHIAHTQITSWSSSHTRQDTQGIGVRDASVQGQKAEIYTEEGTHSDQRLGLVYALLNPMDAIAT